MLKQLNYSRFWAQKKGTRPTGGLGSVKMAGGDATTEQMIASTPRGILVTRLWYLRQVDPRTVLYTGLTRDGTFLIENGKITRSVKNLRFNESPLFMLNNLEMRRPRRAHRRHRVGRQRGVPHAQGARLQLHEPVGRRLTGRETAGSRKDWNTGGR